MTPRCGRSTVATSRPSRASPPRQPHPVAHADRRRQAAQCGYCISGIVVAAHLLSENADPSDADVRASPRRQPVPLRRPQPDRARRACRGGRNRAQAVNVTSPRRTAAVAGGQPAARRLAADRPDGTVEVRSGKVELGQGVLTALAQMVAEELDVDMARVRMTATATGLSPDEGYTAGSLSIQHSGAALRVVCAEARRSTPSPRSAGVPNDELIVRRRPDHRARRPDDQLLGAGRRHGAGPPCHRRRRTQAGIGLPVVGTDVPGSTCRTSCPGGRASSTTSAPDGMVYGRVVRPPSRGATLTDLDTGDDGVARCDHRRARRRLPRRGRRARGGRAARRRAAARTAHGTRGRRCPTRTTCPRS